MAIPLDQLPSDLIWNGQLDVSNPVKQAKYNQLNDAYNSSNGGGGGSSGPPTLSQADMVNLRNQAADATQAYYDKLAVQAKGDFATAVKLMTTDYQQGVRQAKEKYAYEQKYGTNDLTNALGTLGITFGQENESLMDTLNKRGIAVYDQGPNNQPNVVTPTPFQPTTDTTNFTYGSNLSNSNPTANLGRGGFEIARQQQDQSLRAEAEMRAKMQPLEQSGITLKQYTNPGTGFDPNNPGAYTGDRSQLGTQETGLITQNQTASQNLRNTLETQANQRSQDINTIAGQAAQTGTSKLSQDTIAQLQKQENNSFIQGGQTGPSG